MLKIYHSNRLEHLAAHLAATIQVEPLQSVLAAEVIVTQHQGMARWLSIQLAQVQGISANCDYPLPASYIWALYRSQLDEVPEHSTFDRSTLAWRLMALLPTLLDELEFIPLKQYLEGGRDQLKQYQLCRYIADTFEQYLIYRPEWIHAWQRGENKGCEKQPWQSHLWRALVADQAPLHRASLHQQFMQRAAAGNINPETLPQRLMIFGINSLPPAYLEVLAAVAQHIDVHLFSLNPCLAFWEDIADPKTLARLRQRWQSQGKPDVSEMYEVGNSLLASMGKQGRDFQRLIHQEQYATEDHDCTVYLDEGNLLESIQSDILQLLERGQGDYDASPVAVDDDSLTIHSCHSPMREVQVLYDQLLQMFEQDPELLPRDIIVMTPEIDTYAPYIEAIFSTASEGRVIPWSIADRSAQAEHPVLNTFLQLLQLPAARMNASEVLAMLEVPSISRRYGLDEQALQRIRQWVQESGIRWGLDGESRRELDQPADDRFSWQFGLQRLMLGYALPPEEQIYQGYLPYIHIEGMEAQWLGKLQRFLDDLAALRKRLARSHTPAQWQGLINDILSRFEIEGEDEQQAMQLLRSVVHDLSQQTAAAGYEQPIPLEVVQDYLKGHLLSPASPHRFLAGQVSFCAMMPMRSLPFKVVCMIGMNESAYPRTRPPLGFDLMVDNPRPGDRSRRDDDRYLFLEALLSARQKLYISYTGRSIRDNSLMLPSVLVSELQDYIEQGFISEAGEPIVKQLITEHPLQPFSPRYFQGDPQLFSYDLLWSNAARVRQKEPQVRPFIDAALPPAEAAQRSLSLHELIRFFNAPTRYFLQQRLGIYLEQADDETEDSEPFTLDSLQVYQLKQQLLEQSLQGGDLEHYREILKGKAELPAGAFAEVFYDNYSTTTGEFAESLKAELKAPLEPIELDLKIGDFHLHGWLANVTHDGLQSYRYTKIKAKDRLALWLNHLALCAINPAGVALKSRHFAEDGTLCFAPVDDPLHQLQRLLQHYWQGLQKPLPFYPESSLLYTTLINKGKADEALAKAEKNFLGSDYYPGEGADPYLQLVLRDQHPFDGSFIELAEAIYQPLLCAEEAEK
ncbi:Exodeoxyribonuclease V gamma chain [hydrothermal vent metagenome]|uniref:Exodeoxyribonuclease V gamma chain n=1 Tax=hydrothermal vent metagenome TaxID=652676 RepID=A0A3B0ZXQ8_9ZZZZ